MQIQTCLSEMCDIQSLFCHKNVFRSRNKTLKITSRRRLNNFLVHVYAILQKVNTAGSIYLAICLHNLQEEQSCGDVNYTFINYLVHQRNKVRQFTTEQFWRHCSPKKCDLTRATPLSIGLVNPDKKPWKFFHSFVSLYAIDGTICLRSFLSEVA